MKCEQVHLCTPAERPPRVQIIVTCTDRGFSCNSPPYTHTGRKAAMGPHSGIESASPGISAQCVATTPPSAYVGTDQVATAHTYLWWYVNSMSLQRDRSGGLFGSFSFENFWLDYLSKINDMYSFVQPLFIKVPIWQFLVSLSAFPVAEQKGQLVSLDRNGCIRTSS